MTQEDIFKMAQEAGFDVHRGEWLFQMLERFAALVAAAERESIIAKNAPEIARVNAHIKALEDDLMATAFHVAIEQRKPVAWRKNYQNSGYTYFDERWGTIPDDAEPLFSN